MRWQSWLAVSLAILSIIISSLAACYAWQANQIAEQANQIAQEYHQMVYQTNLPIISAVSEITYDEEGYLSTQRLEVINGGGPLKRFHCAKYGIIYITSYDGITYMPVYGYFGNEKLTGNSQGLLLSAFTENNYKNCLSIEREFRDAAQKDGYYFIWTRVEQILLVWYFDQFDQHWEKCLCSFVHGSSFEALDGSWAEMVINSSEMNAKTAQDMGLNCHIGALNGSELWKWYKAEILE